MPRLVKVACPQCGAGMRIDPRAQVATCSYCRLSSFVHLPNRPDPPQQPGKNYGHIHVPSNALKTVGCIVGLTTLAPLLIFMGVAVVLVVVGAATVLLTPKPTRRTSPVSTAPVMAGSLSAACEKAVACCRVVVNSTGNATNQSDLCEGLRALPDSQCTQQYEQFKTSATSLKLNCQ